VCGLDNDTYRDILRKQAGVNSCKELRSKRQIDSVMVYLSNLAEKADRKANRRDADWKWEDTKEGKQLIEKAAVIATRSNRPSLSQLCFIFGLWWSLRSEWKKNDDQTMEATLNHFLKNGRGGKSLSIASWQWLTYDMSHHLIDVLRGRLTTQGKKQKKKVSE